MNKIHLLLDLCIILFGQCNLKLVLHHMITFIMLFLIITDDVLIKQSEHQSEEQPNHITEPQPFRV